MPIEMTNDHRDQQQATLTVWPKLISIAQRLSLAIVIFVVLNLLGIVGIVYFHRVDNDPFLNPVKISEIAADRITLKDGRTFFPIGDISDRTREKVRETKMRVDLEVDETNLVTLYGRNDIFVCGLGMPLITLPIIPSKIPKYNRTQLEIGELEGLPRKANFRTCPEEEPCGNESHG